MVSTMPAAEAPRLLMPDAPTVAVGPMGAVCLGADGEFDELSADDLARRLHSWPAGDAPPVVCHAPALARRLDIAPFRALDVLELFAFASPATFCLPTARGLARSLELALPRDLFDEAKTLSLAIPALLRRIAASRRERNILPIAWSMARAGWTWAPAVLAALGRNHDDLPLRGSASGLDVWRRLPEWSERAPPPPPQHHPVDPAEARQRLAQMLAHGAAEDRPQQADYASAVCAGFRPSERDGEPNVVLAEAGTGVGKTQGYIAPASVWTDKNEGAVWFATYTRNLQHQIDSELNRLYPDAAEKTRRVVIRKGRENYLCLLNLEEAVRTMPAEPAAAVPLGLMARWVERSRDGDMVGGDFPAWLADIAGWNRSMGLRDSRGECIYSACPHYHKCFIERSIRRARHARIVVANHAWSWSMPRSAGSMMRPCRPTTCSTRDTICSMRRTAPFRHICPAARPPNCGAGYWAPRAGAAAAPGA